MLGQLDPTQTRGNTLHAPDDERLATARPAELPTAALNVVPVPDDPRDITASKPTPGQAVATTNAASHKKADPLAAILPTDRQAEMALVLTQEDFATLRHLAEKGTGKNTLRAIASDLTYLEAWAQAATSTPLPWPATEALALKFVAHHLFDEDERERDETHGMPRDVRATLLARGRLKVDGAHAPATVRRRLALWATMHRWKGLDAPFSTPSLRQALRLAVRANPRPRARKSERAITRDILERLLASCDDASFVGVRDKAILLLAFAAGGRRRSEIANLKLRDLIDKAPLTTVQPDGALATLPTLEIRLGRTKTAAAEADESVHVVGRPVVALKHWIALAGISAGPVFRSIDRLGRLANRPLDPQTINAIVKKRCALAGLDPQQFSAHGLRSGYLTEAAQQGISLQEAMAQSRHRSVQQAANYYNAVAQQHGRAARLG